MTEPCQHDAEPFLVRDSKTRLVLTKCVDEAVAEVHDS